MRSRKQIEQRRVLRVLILSMPSLNANVIRKAGTRHDWRYVLWTDNG